MNNYVSLNCTSLRVLQKKNNKKKKKKTKKNPWNDARNFQLDQVRFLC